MQLNDDLYQSNWFTEKSYGLSKAGEKNITFIGDVKQVNINQLKN